MQKINYRIWARIIQFFLCFGIAIWVMAIVLSILSMYVKSDFYIDRVDYGYRNFRNGFPARATMYLDIPDTVVQYQSGTMGTTPEHAILQWKYKDTSALIDTVFNQFISDERNYSLATSSRKNKVMAGTQQASNHIWVPQKVLVRVKTNKAFHQWFYIINHQLENFFGIAIAICVIMLLQAYLKGQFLCKRSFDLIAKIGYLLIWMNGVVFVFSFVSSHVMPDFHLNSVVGSSGNLTNFVGVSLVSNIEISPAYLLVGIAILILSDIIKNAVLIKREQDLTI